MTKNKFINLIKKIVDLVPDLPLNESVEYDSMLGIYKKHKLTFFFNHFTFVIEKLLEVSFPIVLAFAFGLQNTFQVITVLLIYFLFHPIIGVITEYVNVIHIGKILQSMGLQANKFFLSVDPIYHTNKSTGVIISKTNRLVKSFEGINDHINYEFIPKILSSFVAIIYAFTININLGILCFISLFILLVIGLYLQLKTVRGLNNDYIKAEDNVSKNLVQNINGYNLIRSSFAVNQRYKKSKEVYNEMKHHFNYYHFGRTVVWTLIRYFSAVALILIIFMLYRLYEDGSIDLVTLFASTYVSLDAINNAKGLGKVYSNTIQKYLNVKDFFDFKNQFGNQTFKVLK